MREGYQLLEAGATKTQWLVMKFGMFLLAQRKTLCRLMISHREKCIFVTPYWTAPAIDQPLTDQDYPRYRVTDSDLHPHWDFQSYTHGAACFIWNIASIDGT